MATQTSLSIKDLLCADPAFGSVYHMLFNGGSWFEADQMYWRILQQNAVTGVQELVKTKPTKGGQEKAQALLAQLQSTSSQLFPQDESVKVFQQTEQIVKSWTPAAKAPVAKSLGKKNVFAMLDDDE